MSFAPTHLCTHCMSTIRPVKITKGSFLIELGLWIMLILPGLVYSLWRLSSRYTACPVCKAENPIPLSSPAAKTLLNARR
jgi:hypothetical protein